MSLRVVNYKKRLDRQAHKEPLARMKEMQKLRFVWFALVPDYGEYYGDVKRIYKPTRTLRLLDLSTMHDRMVIALELGEPIKSLDPEDQYSAGTSTNYLMHSLLEPLLLKYNLDGTIIEDARADEECQGPTEVVLRGSSVRHIKRVF